MEDFRSEAYLRLGNIIRKKRIEKNLTQEELGELVGYGEGTRRQAISQIERGSFSIPNKKMSAFIDALELDAPFIMEINYKLSKGDYEDVASLLQEREEREEGIALSGQTIGLAAQMGKPDPVLHEHPHTEMGSFESGRDAETLALEEAEEKLLKLKELRDKDLITDEEFITKKKDILDRYF